MRKSFAGLGLTSLLFFLPIQGIYPLLNLEAQAQTDRQAEAGRLINQGLQQYRSSQFESAFRSWQQALQIYRDLKDRTGEGKVLNNLGIAYYSLGRYEESVKFLHMRLAIARELHDRRAEGNALDGIGLNYMQLGQFDRAIAFYPKALEIFRELNDRTNEGNASGNLGIAYRELGRYEQALAFHQQQLAITREIKDRAGEGRALGGLGIVYRELGQYDKAIAYLQQDLAIAKEFNDRGSEGRALNNLGIVYSKQHQYEKAIVTYQRVIDVFHALNDRNSEARALGNLAVIYSIYKQYDNAIAFHQQQLAIARDIKDLATEARALDGLGIAYQSKGQHEQAIASYQQELAIIRELKDRNGEARALNNFGLLLASQNQPQLAILSYKQSVNIQESIRKDIRGLSKEEQQSFLETVADTYRYLADLLLKQGRVMEAMQILDLLKIQELEDYLKNVKGNDRTAQGIRLLEPEKAISSQLSAISFEKISELNRQLANQIQQLPKSEINQVPEYLQKLPKGAVLIYPLILSDRLELILFSANTTPINRTVTIKKADLEKLISDFRSDLQDFSSIDVKTSSKKLYDVLIKPIASDLKQANANTILYAPDRQLRYIPLAALYDGKQWLVEKYRVNNLIAYSLFDPDSKPQANLRIFAGAFGGKGSETRFGLGGLPSTIPEVENIASTFLDTTKLVERNFTANATKAKVVGQTIVHFATHSEFKSGSPNDSYVLFGDGSKVTLAEINEWQLKDADLVVLSACQTGVGSLGNGAEILGFGYQVQRAGAKASIASLWTVSDGGTQLLMEAFYGSLKKGNVSMSASLREAQLSMIRRPINKGAINYNHPYYWSAFVLIGNGL
ncbi:CHAT domain-containing protein [Tumidithrix elongata RA019]|uniref:CHAT domain-containing protein n=1 Tax=Tumidithrix elongata BACA0141 TaxID=2716417 RepID=A0AAW9Q2B3_9CYAN|nr:CHAT domain-containing protein [Tumidithrix elongata RA019]